MYENVKISEPMRKQLDSELVDGESVEWMGQPQFNFFMPTSLVSLFIGLLMLGGSFAWSYWLYNDADYTPLKKVLWAALFSFQFYILSLIIVLNPLKTWLQARRILYVITNSRVILLAGSRKIVKHSLLPDELEDISCHEKPDGTGDIALTPCQLENNPYNYVSYGTVLSRVDNPLDVEKMVKELAAKSDTKTAVQSTQNRSHIQVL